MPFELCVLKVTFNCMIFHIVFHIIYVCKLYNILSSVEFICECLLVASGTVFQLITLIIEQLLPSTLN